MKIKFEEFENIFLERLNNTAVSLLGTKITKDTPIHTLSFGGDGSTIFIFYSIIMGLNNYIIPELPIEAYGFSEEKVSYLIEKLYGVN